MTTETLNDVAAQTVREDVPSLSDLAAPVGGAWPKGWYAAEVIEGYSTPKGKVFTTSDDVSQRGDSRNARLCLKVTNAAGDSRTMQESFNYREADFSLDRIAFIKDSRRENASVKGAWADKDAQRTSLALAKIGQLEQALGFALRSSENRMIPGRAIGQKLDVRLGENEDGFNEVTAYDKSATKVKKSA